MGGPVGPLYKRRPSPFTVRNSRLRCVGVQARSPGYHAHPLPRNPLDVCWQRGPSWLSGHEHLEQQTVSNLLWLINYEILKKIYFLFVSFLGFSFFHFFFFFSFIFFSFCSFLFLTVMRKYQLIVKFKAKCKLKINCISTLYKYIEYRNRGIRNYKNVRKICCDTPEMYDLFGIYWVYVFNQAGSYM